MSTEMNKQTGKNPGLVVFLILRVPVGAADVASVSRCNYGESRYAKCATKQRKR